MLRKLFRSFLKPYVEGDYLLLARAKLLLIFIIIFIFLIILVQFSMLFAGWEDFIKTLYITPLLLTGFCISLFFSNTAGIAKPLIF